MGEWWADRYGFAKREGCLVGFLGGMVWPMHHDIPAFDRLASRVRSQGISGDWRYRQYGYAWDANANKAAKASEEVSLEAELDMLNKFMASHDLKHPTMVTPAESMMNSNYGVSGFLTRC